MPFSVGLCVTDDTVVDGTTLSGEHIKSFLNDTAEEHERAYVCLLYVQQNWMQRHYWTPLHTLPLLLTQCSILPSVRCSLSLGKRPMYLNCLRHSMALSLPQLNK